MHTPSWVAGRRRHKSVSGSDDEEDEESALLSPRSKPTPLLSRAADGGWDDDSDSWAADNPDSAGGHRRRHEARGAAGSKDGFGLPRRLRWLHKLRVGRPRERSKIAALDLFRYRSRTDEALMIIAAVLSAANGIMMPMSTVLFGSLVQQLNSPHRAELHSTTFTHNQLHAFTHPGDADWTQWKEAAASSVDVSNPLLFLRWSRSLLSFLTFYVLIGGLAMLTGGAVNALLPTTLATTTVHCLTALLPLPYCLTALLSTALLPYCPYLTTMLTGYAEVGLWMIISERQLHRVRVLYLHAVLRQEMAWFDENRPSELPS